MTYSCFPLIRGAGEVTNGTIQHDELCDGDLQARKDSWYGAQGEGTAVTEGLLKREGSLELTEQAGVPEGHETLGRLRCAWEWRAECLWGSAERS